ncbi:PAQR family membrane homeostasis protein TrhA [Fulvivirga lutea]|uniref:Hemolysin III family protein n=1 Tax=Fulvivirga lutea TaxID=2810512 RepID=A0A974WDX6_9BACT|nr:hemolysin III family protein [Fulvivirga lutea]QSE96449.1 hemolysin III family protein [Fulvivirga lutea]
MKNYSILGFEEPVSSWTHLLGAFVVLLLTIKLFMKGGAGRRYPAAIIIYSISCVFLLSMSGVYHLLPRDTSARYVLRVLDHAGIFLLIAGTLIAVHEILFSGLMKWGVIILASVIASVGITLGSIYFNDIPAYLTHSVYLAFGWLGLASIIGIYRLRKDVSIKYLVYGGLAYTFGAIIDLFEYPVLVEGYIGTHEIFHFAVLMGVFFHWLFLLRATKAADQSK